MYRPFLALRYLLTRPINLLGMFGVTLGVWALIVVVAIFSGFLRVVSEHVKSASSDLSVLYLGKGTRYGDLRAAIEADPNIAATAPRIVHFGLLHRPGERPPPMPLLGRGALQGGDTPFMFVLGIDPAREVETTKFGDWLMAVQEPLRVRDRQQPLQAIDGLPAILLGEERMLAAGLRPGDHVVLTTGTDDAGGGGVPRPRPTTFAVAGAYRTLHAQYDGNNAFVQIDELGRLLRLPADTAHEVSVRVIDESTTEATAERVERIVRRAMREDRLPANRGAVAWSWRHRHRMFLSAVEWQRELLKIILVVIMVVAAVLMYATLSEMVAEKRSDIGILTAMGATPRGVMLVFLSCGLAITLAGLVLGTIAGCLSAMHLEDLRQFLLSAFDIDLFPVKVYNLDRVPYELDPWWNLQVAVAAICIGILVSALPALRAARHDPLVTLRGE